MNACIIAINSGHEKVMGYATCQRNGNLALKSSNIPVIKGKNILVGINGNEQLLNDLKISPLLLSMENPPHIAVDTIRKTIRKDYVFSPEVLILTSNNYIFHWASGNIKTYTEFDESYLAIGPGSEIAMGAIYGLRSSRYTVREQMEIALQAIKRFYPEMGQTTGLLNL